MNVLPWESGGPSVVTVRMLIARWKRPVCPR